MGRGGGGHLSAHAGIRGGGPEPKELSPWGEQGTGPFPLIPWGALALVAPGFSLVVLISAFLGPRAVPPGNKFLLFSGTQFGVICYSHPRTLPDSVVLDVSSAQKLLGAHLRVCLLRCTRTGLYLGAGQDSGVSVREA